MVFFFSSQTYQSMITKTISETEQICSGGEVGEEIYLLKYVKEHITMFRDIEILIVDLLALADTNEEIIAAFESLRIMDYNTRFILLAAKRQEGDALLRDCFYMGIYDIIATDDYLQIHEQLTECIQTGMKYKDALRFRDAREPDNSTQAESKAIQKVLIGITGAGERRGCTHNSIVFANFLREKGYMVAIAEMNQTGAFAQIQEVQRAKLFEEGYFSLRGVDFYLEVSQEKLLSITGKLYNFILLDFGDYQKMDKILFHKCDIRLVLSGAKPWETDPLNGIFADVEEEVLKTYHFCFLFAATQKEWQRDLQESMAPLDQIYFPVFTEDPFESADFSEGNEILKEYFPYVGKQKKKGRAIFRKRKGN